MATKTLPPRLAALKEKIEDYAREFGLDFYETIFEVVSYDEMNMIAAYGGFPNRYPHWRFGMEYEQISKSYEYGLSLIYEMVINNDPCFAYLLEANAETDQKVVMAHVYGHCDFFKNNYMFANTNRKMMDAMGNHSTKIRKFADKLGVEKVENFIDQCLSVENLIDRNSPFIRRVSKEKPIEQPKELGLKVDREYMRGFMNPQAFLDQQKQKQENEAKKAKFFPENPQRDILQFLIEHAPLEGWELEVLSIIREEAYYFSPQGQTKIMNEGWAAYWHSKIMTTRALDDSEIIDYADHNAGILGGGKSSFNPYKIGVELYRHIEDRWNKGQFGKEFNDCDDMLERRNWDKKLGQGREKIFEVRKHYNDVTFIDEFLTPEFCKEQELFVYEEGKRDGDQKIDRDFRKIKARLLHQLTNFGQPDIEVVNGNFDNKGELLIHHKHDGQDLKLDYARDTLANLVALWRRPVNLSTIVDKKKILLKYDGREHSEYKIE